MSDSSMDKPAADILAAAADYLVRNGWQQGAIGGRGLPACAAGAVLDVVAQTGAWEVRNSALKALADRLGLPLYTQIATWNDEPHRTAEQVIKELRATAADLRGEPA